MVKQIDSIFDALHQIILSFFFKLAVFSPALVNAVLVGFGVGSFAGKEWGRIAGLISGLVAAIAIEAASVIASWNMDAKKVSTYILPVLYIGGSWIVVWIGLNDGWLVNVVGFVMPIFAVSLPGVIADRKRRLEEGEAERQKREMTINYQKERTKQERAKARAVKASNLASNSVKNMSNVSKEDALQWLAERPDVSPTIAAQELGVSRQTVYNYRQELSDNANGKL
jgi:hypothetical protein